MPYKEILMQIKNILSSVPETGSIYDYMRWDKADWKGFFDLFKQEDGRCFGWMITRVKTDESRDICYNMNMRTHTFKLYGFYPLYDEIATEKWFQNKIEEICQKFRDNPTLNGVAFDTFPVSISFENRVLGGMVVHWAEITLETKERVPYKQ